MDTAWNMSLAARCRSQSLKERVPMSIHISRSIPTLVSIVLVSSTLAMLDGCSKANDDNTAAALPTSQAQAVQSSIASAQVAHDHPAPSMRQDNSTAAPGAPMAMGVPGSGSPSTNMGAPSGGASTGMARMLGQPPMASGSQAIGGLPAAIGAPHIYHLGANSFFLDRASAIGLTSEQQRRLTALRENAALAYTTTQRKIAQGEQDLWALSSSEAPDLAKIDTKIGEIARLTGQQRMDFIRTVGEAVGVLSDDQRKAAASQGSPLQPGTLPPAPSVSGMSTGDGAPAAGGMGMGGPSKTPMGMDPSGGMPPPGMGMGGTTGAGSSGGMGHM